jgi:hypothetical protein
VEIQMIQVIVAIAAIVAMECATVGKLQVHALQIVELQINPPLLPSLVIHLNALEELAILLA